MGKRGLISVDTWEEGSSAYFLTHMHADHMRGLSPKWARGPLYCSPTTALLLPVRFPGIDGGLIRPLAVGVGYSLSLPSPHAAAAPVEVTVTLIDACHCPGAVMYLFRGEYGTMLFTGDFRWETSNVRDQLARKCLLDALQGDKVDFLYLDNTFCHPSFTFPSRAFAAEKVIDIIKRHPDHEIVIGIDTLGKEELLVRISEALSTKIWVWPERLQTMHLLGYEGIFTTKTCLTRVRAVPRYSLTIQTLESLNTVCPTIGIMPSGLPWEGKSSKSVSNKSEDTKNERMLGDTEHVYSAVQFHPLAYSVAYSNHSCYHEIEEFVRILRPSTITGIVNSSSYYNNPRYYFRALCPTSGASEALHDELDTNAECLESKSSKYYSAYKNSCIPRRKKDTPLQVSSSVQSRSRFWAMRRERRGAKITEQESI